MSVPVPIARFINRMDACVLLPRYAAVPADRLWDRASRGPGRRRSPAAPSGGRPPRGRQDPEVSPAPAAVSRTHSRRRHPAFCNATGG